MKCSLLNIWWSTGFYSRVYTSAKTIAELLKIKGAPDLKIGIKRNGRWIIIAHWRNKHWTIIKKYANICLD